MDHKYPVGPGWWPLLDDVSAKVKALDPDVRLSFKEKYGTCQIDYITESTEHVDEIFRLTDEAEEVSKTICEFCGQPGQLRENRSWLQTLCDRCADLDPLERRTVADETEGRYYHGSYLRHGEPKRLETVRKKTLADFLDDMAKEQGAEAMALNKQLQQDPTAEVPEHITQRALDLIQGATEDKP